MRRCFTLLEILLCLVLLSLGGFALIHYSYKLSQESLSALHIVALEQAAQEQLLFWKEYVYENRQVPQRLEKDFLIEGIPYQVVFQSNKKELNLSDFLEEKSLIYQIEVRIKKEHKLLFSRKYSVLIEVL